MATLDASICVMANEKAMLDRPGEFGISIDLLPDASLMFGRDGIIFRANAATARLLEADSVEQLVGMNLYHFGTLDPKRSAEVVSQLLAGKTIRFELELTTLKGGSRLVEILDVPLVGENGQIEVIFGIGRDITEERERDKTRDFLAAVVESSDECRSGNRY